MFQPIGVVVQHIHRALRREAQALTLELRIGVAVQESLEVILQVGLAQAVGLALEERGQVDDGVLVAVERSLVLVGHRKLGRLAGLDGGVHFVVHIGVAGAGDLGLGRDAVRVALVKLVQHPLEEILVFLRAVVPVGDRDVLALQIDGIDFCRRLGRAAGLSRRGSRGLGRRGSRALVGSGALVGSRALVASGALVGSGAFVGSGALVGAGAAAAGALVGAGAGGVGAAHDVTAMARTTSRLSKTNSLRDLILPP